jgi:hypothetical protein
MQTSGPVVERARQGLKLAAAEELLCTVLTESASGAGGVAIEGPTAMDIEVEDAGGLHVCNRQSGASLPQGIRDRRYGLESPVLHSLFAPAKFSLDLHPCRTFQMEMLLEFALQFCNMLH